MSFVKFVVERATVERALSIPLISEYVNSQGVGDLINEFAEQHPNYSFADLLGEFGIQVEALPVLIKDFVMNHFTAKQHSQASGRKAQNTKNTLTFE